MLVWFLGAPRHSNAHVFSFMSRMDWHCLLLKLGRRGQIAWRRHAHEPILPTDNHLQVSSATFAQEADSDTMRWGSRYYWVWPPGPASVQHFRKQNVCHGSRPTEKEASSDTIRDNIDQADCPDDVAELAPTQSRTTREQADFK